MQKKKKEKRNQTILYSLRMFSTIVWISLKWNNDLKFLLKYSQSVLRGHLGEALKVATYNRWPLISLCLPKVIWSLYMIFFVQYVNITGLSLQTNEILLTWLNLLFILWSCCNNFWFIIKKRIICNSQCTALYFKCNISNATHYYLYLGKPIPL